MISATTIFEALAREQDRELPKEFSTCRERSEQDGEALICILSRSTNLAIASLCRNYATASRYLCAEESGRVFFRGTT